MTIGKEHELHYKNMNTKIIYSDGQQIHQHQQDEQSALISTPTNPPTPTRRTISFSSQLVKHKKDHDIWLWKSRSGLE
jgi:hypothetical protein